MGRKQPTPPPEPTREELEAEWTENREKLHEAHALAKEAFKTTSPTYDQVAAVVQILAGGVEAETVVPLMTEAVALAEKYGIVVKTTDLAPKPSADEVGAVAAIFDILVDDERSADHLADAARECKSLFGRQGDAVLDVYYQIYGAEADFSEMPE
jgi:hypothetical protein